MPKPIENFNSKDYTDKFLKSLYDDGFFMRNKRDKEIPNINIASILKESLDFDSVFDLGCGIGTYLEIFLKNGCTKIKGFEYGYEYSKKYMSEGVVPFVSFGDVTKKLKINEKYDCGMSIEVAEHIPRESSNTLVDNLTKNAINVIIFTAAPPGQGGTGHINCQPPEFWIEKFENRGWFLSTKEVAEVKNKMIPINTFPPKDIQQNVEYYKSNLARLCWKWVYENLMIFRRNK
jgi:hypothetical protein